MQDLDKIWKLRPVERPSNRIVKDDVTLGEIKIVDGRVRVKRRCYNLVRESLSIDSEHHASSSWSTIAGSAVAMPLSVFAARSRMPWNVVHKMCSASLAGRSDLAAMAVASSPSAPSKADTMRPAI